VSYPSGAILRLAGGPSLISSNRRSGPLLRNAECFHRSTCRRIRSLEQIPRDETTHCCIVQLEYVTLLRNVRYTAGMTKKKPPANPKTNAQRQSDYRQRHLHDMDGNAARLNQFISYPAKCALERLSACYGVTQRELLESLITEAEADTVMKITRSGKHESDYYDKNLRLAKRKRTSPQRER
jgi:hypothetical protein